MANDLKCLNTKDDCNWEGAYNEAKAFSKEEMESLRLILFTEKLFLHKEGYDNLVDLFNGYTCPKCDAPLLDLNKIKNSKDTNNKSVEKIIHKIKSLN